jgi:hypothetical protein
MDDVVPNNESYGFGPQVSGFQSRQQLDEQRRTTQYISPSGGFAHQFRVK